MIAAMIAVAGRTAELSLRAGGGGLTGLLFFLCVVVLFPFAVGPDLNLLGRIGSAILWLGALLATLLGLDRLFEDDRADGTLDLYMLSPLPAELLVLAKCAGHWLATGVPLVIAAPVFGFFFNVEPGALGWVALTLLVGTPALTLVGAVGASLMLALRQGSMLVAVLVLPFTIPVLIFGVSATVAVQSAPATLAPPFLILCALTLAGTVVAAVAGAAALRASLE